MKTLLNKDILTQSLPISEAPLIVRSWVRADLELLAAWPDYPFPYEGFNFSFKIQPPEVRERVYQDRCARPDRLSLVVDHTDQRTIGYIALTKIDWEDRLVGNFGFRIHPRWVNQGLGTSVLRMVCLWLFDRGFLNIGMDVAASNTRAIRCYEKVGFTIAGEVWRMAQDLENMDLSDERYDFLQQHLRLDGDVPELRFYWMKITPAAYHDREYIP